MDYTSVPNFMKIKSGQDFFVDLAWNAPDVEVETGACLQYIAAYKVACYNACS